MQANDFWNARAALGETAGTRDVIADTLETRAIAAQITDGMRVLDVGCGVGLTAITLARQYAVNITAIDYSDKMILAAAANAGQVADLKGSVTFRQMDVLNMATLDTFDAAYSKRCLINLPDWPAQQRAIRNILAAVKPGGMYLMVENSADGLASVNTMRVAVGLPAIVAPWHNCYLVDDDVSRFECDLWAEGVAKLESVERIGSLYSILSRVVNAHLASLEGRDPDYNAPVNQLALKLPNVGNVGQYTMWKWRRL